jgi:hypothetical protein
LAAGGTAADGAGRALIGCATSTLRMASVAHPEASAAMPAASATARMLRASVFRSIIDRARA